MITETKINISSGNTVLMQKTYHIDSKGLIKVLPRIYKTTVYFKDVLFTVLGINQR